MSLSLEDTIIMMRLNLCFEAKEAEVSGSWGQKVFREY